MHQFRANLKKVVDTAIENHETVTVTRKNGEPFVVMSLDDYEREQETLYVLGNRSLMKQIAESLRTHLAKEGYRPTDEELGF